MSDTVNYELTKAKAFSSRISKLYELGTEINRKNSVDEILEILKRHLRWLFDYHSTSITLVEGDGITNYHLSGTNVPDLHLPLTQDDVPSGTLHRSDGKFISLIKNDEFYRDFPNMIMLPMKAGTQSPIGCITFAHKTKVMIRTISESPIC